MLCVDVLCCCFGVDCIVLRCVWLVLCRLFLSLFVCGVWFVVACRLLLFGCLGVRCLLFCVIGCLLCRCLMMLFASVVVCCLLFVGRYLSVFFCLASVVRLFRLLLCVLVFALCVVCW